MLVKDYGYKYFIGEKKDGYVIVRDSESILIGARIWRIYNLYYIIEINKVKF